MPPLCRYVCWPFWLRVPRLSPSQLFIPMPIFNRWVQRKPRLMRNFVPRWRSSLKSGRLIKWMLGALLPQVPQALVPLALWALCSVATNLT